MLDVLRYSAFSSSPAGGNPAGVVLAAAGLDAATMQAVAAEVGYSESAFLSPAPDQSGGVSTLSVDAEAHFTVRYFSPLAEVPFCGHATIVTAVAYAERHGPGVLVLHTRAGQVRVSTSRDGSQLTATLTSVPPRVDTVPVADVDEALAALRWSRSDLDPALPPRVAYAGASHLVLAAGTRSRLAELDYNFERLRDLMAARDWTTVQLVHRTGPDTFDARNPFPPGGVYEDPATGAAAAAFGAYLSDQGAVIPPARVTIRQGEDMGRPSTLVVDIPADLAAGVSVSGAAVRIP